MARTISLTARWVLAALAVTVPLVAQMPESPLELRPRQIFHYSVHLRETTNVKLENPGALSVPKSAVIDSQALIKVEVLSVEGENVRIRTSFNALSSDTHFRLPNAQGILPQNQSKGMEEKIVVAATIQPRGVVSNVEGLDSLFPEWRQLWRNWAASFALALMARHQGGQVALAETPASLDESDGLLWKRELMRAGNEACSDYALGVNREPVRSAPLSGGCTKLLVREKLAQSPSGSQREKGKYEGPNLTKSRTVRGKGEIRAQVSKETGWLAKSDSESVRQAKVHFAQADHSDSIQYTSSTKTRIEIRLIADKLLTEASRSSQP